MTKARGHRRRPSWLRYSEPRADTESGRSCLAAKASDFTSKSRAPAGGPLHGVVFLDDGVCRRGRVAFWGSYTRGLHRDCCNSIAVTRDARIGNVTNHETRLRSALRKVCLSLAPATVCNERQRERERERESYPEGRRVSLDSGSA